MNTADLLNTFSNRINQKTTQERASELFTIVKQLKCEFEQTNIVKATTGTKEMLDAMDKIGSVFELEVCHKLLEHYLQTSEFKVHLIANEHTNQETIDNLKKTVIALVNTENVP